MTWYLPEWVHPNVWHHYRELREPIEPRRRRLGLTEREVSELQRPPRRLLVGAVGLSSDWYDRRIDERLAEKKWIELPEDAA